MLSDPSNSSGKEKLTSENDLQKKINKKELSFNGLESMLKQVPKEFSGATTNLSELLVTMNSLMQDSPFKQLLQNVDQTLKKQKEELPLSSWKLIELEQEYVIYVEIYDVQKEDITIEIVDHIVTIKLNHLLEGKIQKVTTHSVTLPFRIDVIDVLAYFSSALIDIHIPKKKTNIITLINRPSNKE